MKSSQGSSRQRGMTLIEAMVAMTLGLLVLAGIASIFVNSSRGYREDAKSAHIHEDLSIAMAQIGQDIEMAGFWTNILAPNRIDVDRDPVANTGTLAVDPGCWTGGTYIGRDVASPPNIVLNAVTLLSNVTGATANAAFPCIAAADVQAGTDIIALRRLIGAPTGTYTNVTGLPTTCAASGATANTPVCNRVYLRTNGSSATLFKPAVGALTPTVAPAIAAPTADVFVYDWEYRVAIYFVRNYAVTAGDGVPSLCRYVLQGGLAMQIECVAQGIENMQLEVGVDTNNDGVPDYYTNDVTSVSALRVVAVRTSMLARSVDLATSTGATDTLLGRTGTYTSSKTYTLAGGSPNGATVTPASTDHFYRKLAVSVAVLRNPTSWCVVFGGCT